MKTQQHSLESNRRGFIKLSAMGAAALPLSSILGQPLALAEEASNPPLKFFEKASSQKIPAMEGEEAAAFLTDIVVSDDKEKPITAGLFRLEKGKPLTYTYTYDEVKVVIGGSYEIEDGTGQKVTAVVGDVFYFPKGSKITFTTPDFGLGFFCGQRGLGEA